MAKVPNKRPTIGERDIVRLLVSTYGATQVLRYFNSDLKKYLAQANVFVAENKPLGMAQALAKMIEISNQIGIVLGDYDNVEKIDAYKPPKQ